MPTIFCVGRNYAAHVREMGGAADPVVFLKPGHALLAPPGPIHLPPGAGAIHHEIEVVVRVGKDGAAEAVALGLDLTARDLQADAKAHGKPWAAAKGFRNAAPLGPFVAVSTIPPLDALRFTLTVNGHVRQTGDTALMLRQVPELIASVDAWFGVRPGDLLFTGTPEGVGPIAPGDLLTLDLVGVPAAAAVFRVAPGAG